MGGVEYKFGVPLDFLEEYIDEHLYNLKARKSFLIMELKTPK